LENNKYKPEADFEKNLYKDLIDEIRTLQNENISQEEKERILSEIKKEKYIQPYEMRTKSSVTAVLFRYRFYIAFGTLLVLIFAGYFLYFKKGHPIQDYERIIITQDTTVTSRDIIHSKDLALTEKSLQTKNESYFKSLYSEVEKNYDYRFSTFEESDIKTIVKSNEFYKRIMSINKAKRSRKDTIGIIIKIIKLGLY
jgi:hypothetical protein